MVDGYNYGSNPKPVTKGIICCMDGRGNFEVDKENNSDAVVLRGPGPNLFANEMRTAVKKALDKYDDLTEFVLMPHMRCGAMGAVNDTLHLDKKADPQIYSSLIQPFHDKGIKFKDRDDLESTVNPATQKAQLEEIIDGNRMGSKERKTCKAGGSFS